MNKEQIIASEHGHQTVLKRFLVRYPALTFFLMGLSFLLVGLISLNLIYLFSANIDYIRENGVMALRDGGLKQFIGLVVSGYLALMLYLFFKTCEKVLVEWMLERKRPKQVTTHSSDNKIADSIDA